MDSIHQDLGNRMDTEGTEISGPYTAEKSLEYILSKVILILRTFNETFSIDDKGEFIPNIELDDEDAAPMVTGGNDDAALGADDDDAAAAPMVTGGNDDAALGADDDAAAAPMVTGGNAPMVSATDDGSGGSAVASVSDKDEMSSGAKRRRIGGDKKTRRKHKRNHKKSRRKPRKKVSPGRWLRKPKRYSRNKKLKLRKRKTTRRKKEI
jgi:hypothetical protein